MKILCSKYKKIIGLFSAAVVIFGATGTAISFAVKANENSLSEATKLANEFSENIGWNDVESVHKELINSYEERLNNDAEYEDLRNDPNHTISEYVSNFNNFLKYEILDKKLKKYSPRAVYEKLWEISQEYKLNVLDWEYAINYSQLVIDNSAKEINGIANLSKEQKIAINKNTSEKIEYLFKEARSKGWTALEFINHFTTSMSSEIKNQRNALAEKAITNNKLLEFLSSQKLKINEQVLPNNLEIDLKNLAINTDVSHLLPYLFKYNGYPINSDIIDGYKLGLIINKNEKINVFQRKFSFLFSLIKKNSDFFIDAPANQEMENIMIFESVKIQNKLVAENIVNKSTISLKNTNISEGPMAYTDFVLEVKGHENDIPFETLNKIFDFNIDREFQEFFVENSDKLNEKNNLFRIVGKLISLDSDEKCCSIAFDIQNISENKMLSNGVDDLPQYKVYLGLTKDEQWETIQFLAVKLFKVVENSEIAQAIFSMFSPDLESKLDKKVNFNIAFLTVESAALCFYTAMAVIQWINVVITFGGCLWSAIGYTACVVATVISIVFLAMEESENIISHTEVKKIITNETYKKTFDKWNDKSSEKIKSDYFDFVTKVYSFFNQFKTFDYDTKFFSKDEFLNLYGGENGSIYLASKKIFSFWNEFIENFLNNDEVANIFGFALAMDSNPEEIGKYAISIQRFFETFVGLVDMGWIITKGLIEFFLHGTEQTIGLFFKTRIFSNIMASLTANIGYLGSKGVLWFTQADVAFTAMRFGAWRSFVDLALKGEQGLRMAWRAIIDFFSAYKFWNVKIPIELLSGEIPFMAKDYLKAEALMTKVVTTGYRNIMQTDMVCATLVSSPFLVFFEIILGLVEMGMSIASMCQ